jgi:hypothetical protein
MGGITFIFINFFECDFLSRRSMWGNNVARWRAHSSRASSHKTLYEAIPSILLYSVTYSPKWLQQSIIFVRPGPFCLVVIGDTVSSGS